jgi:RHS repeat-associated protein
VLGIVIDANGNTLGDGSKTYTWDVENRLTSLTVPGIGSTTFRYDPFGRRIQKSGPLGTTNFLYDGLNLLEEVDNAGSVLARYTQGKSLDEPLAQLRSGTSSYYEADGLGTITSLSNTSGALAQTYTFDSFGNQTASSGSLTNPFRYTAREFDPETGIYEYRARYYDQNIGRFVSEDPARFNGRGPNFYAYVKNSPVGKFDPTGLATCDYYIQGPDGNGWLYCSPDDPRNSPVSFPAASGNNGDAQHHCKNNPDCASESGTGPIPPGHYHFSTDIATHKHSGTLLIPDDPAAVYYRNGLLTHFCLNPFGPSRKKPFCSEGCITASQDDINALNDLLSSEPNNTMTVYPGLPLQ